MGGGGQCMAQWQQPDIYRLSVNAIILIAGGGD